MDLQIDRDWTLILVRANRKLIWRPIQYENNAATFDRTNGDMLYKFKFELFRDIFFSFE